MSCEFKLSRVECRGDEQIANENNFAKHTLSAEEVVEEEHARILAQHSRRDALQLLVVSERRVLLLQFEGVRRDVW
jgi:hypothetical protein